MTPAEMIDAVEHALRKPRREKRPLQLLAPVVLGHSGTLIGHLDGQVPVYGYTRKQAEAIRAIIFEAARADLEGSG